MAKSNISAISNRKTTSGVDSPGLRLDIYGLIIIALSSIVILSLFSYSAGDFEGDVVIESTNLIGPVGSYIANFFITVFGLGSFVLAFGFLAIGVLILMQKSFAAGPREALSGVGLMFSSAILMHIVASGGQVWGQSPGGVVGEYSGELLKAFFSTVGASILTVTAMILCLLVLTGKSLRQVALMLRRKLPQIGLRLLKLPVQLGRKAIDRGTTVWRERQERRALDTPVTKPARPTEAKDERPEPDGPVIVRREPLEHEPSIVNPPEGTPAAQTPRVAAVPARLSKQRKTSAKTDSAESSDTTVDPPTSDVINEKTTAPGQPQSAPVQPEQSAVEPAPRRTRTKKPKPAAGPDPLIVESPAMKQAGQIDIVGAQQQRLFEEKHRRYDPFPLSLLNYEPPKLVDLDRESLKQNAQRLEKTLENYKVQGKVVEIHPGPVVTTYEYLPDPGVKISKIANLSDDLTMALKAYSVRIVAPIPGKGVVGIEVPNDHREFVYLKEIFGSKQYNKSKSKLTVALGKDIVGNPVVGNLAKMPHLLVAGATGSGKSVGINCIICSLLYNASPEDVKLILVDPKMLELSVYSEIPHLLLPVVTDPKKANLALKWAVEEMERRYKMLAKMSVRNIANYNRKVEEMDEEIREDAGFKRLPYIVVIIDELADLMMVASKEVETSIARLAQMARAAGIHLILATQRPSVDVITGLIKANFPARMSFQVASKIDSRTILDINGAEKLLGNGDMLYLPPGTSRLQRVHGAFVTDDEVKRLSDFVRSQGEPDYQFEILERDTEGGSDEEIEYDALYDQAVAIVCETRQASISYLQRRLKVGYNRSARMIEIMELEGIVGPSDGSKPRRVLVPSPSSID